MHVFLTYLPPRVDQRPNFSPLVERHPFPQKGVQSRIRGALQEFPTRSFEATHLNTPPLPLQALPTP